MGKNVASRHQRFVKSEKAKVKLKGKKDLPKGTNVTKTAFKVKKIVIREQLKTAQGGQPLSKSKLGVKELLTRLTHFNTTARTDALNGLKELITGYQHEVLSNNLGQLIKGVTPLVLDKERNVRRESYKVLHMILSPLSSEKITPFFDILCSYLRCAMTHIDTRIHEDSLLYFDILLLCSPDLVAINIHKILPSFLDMISKLRVDSKPGRTLMVNLGSKMTSVKWRTKVLSRLHQLLQTMTDIKNKQHDGSTVNRHKGILKNKNASECTRKYCIERENYFPIYKGLQQSNFIGYLQEKNTILGIENEGLKLQAYIDTLVPLLFETWLEVRPMTSNSVRKVESFLSEEAALLLRYILHILHLLWQLSCIIESEQRNIDLSNWFIGKYKKDFSQYVSSSFPYTQGFQQSGKRNAKLKNFENSTVDEKCTQENLLICHIYVILNIKLFQKLVQSDCDKVFDYLIWSVDNLTQMTVSCQGQFFEILHIILQSKDWVKCNKIFAVLESLISLYWQDNLNQSLKQNLFSLLCSILLNGDLIELQNIECFQTWLRDLPNIICGPKIISLESFQIIYNLAVQNNKLFNESISNKLILFIKCLPSMKISEISDDKATKKKLIGLLYWIKQWDNESLNILQDQLVSQRYDNDTKDYLIEILKSKTEGLFL